MKKLFLSLALASAVAFANAQDMTSKKGFPILPEAGDWSIGFDATNLIQYFGNLMNGSNNNSSLGAQQNQTLVGLYVKDETTSYRGKLRIGFGSTSSGNTLTNHADSVGLPKEVKTSGMNITIGGGIQKNRGKGRLRGIYGAELQIMLTGSSKTTNDYALPITATDPGPRVTETKTGSTFGIGIDGFIGAEYFFAPKMSISAEYAWGLVANNGSPGITSTSEAETTTEMWDVPNNVLKTTTTKGPKSSAFTLDVMNAGSIVFHCYF